MTPTGELQDSRPSTDRPLRLVVITGATATGKTRLAVQAAHAWGSEIISADSRQVYRGLDIGTGKDLHEYSEVSPPVPYHLIDVVEPESVYTLYHFQRDCYEILKEKHSAAPFDTGTPLLLVGGTPLYIAAILLEYEIPNVPEDKELRSRLEALSLAELTHRLETESPEIFSRTDLSTKRRVVRAMEVATHARRHPLKITKPPPFHLETTVFAMKVDRAILHERIDRRLEARLNEGLAEEVQALLDRGLSPQRLEQLGLEYREVASYLLGRSTRAEMVHNLKVAIHRFARRQEVWFRGFERKGIPIRWIEPDDIEAVLHCFTPQREP